MQMQSPPIAQRVEAGEVLCLEFDAQCLDQTNSASGELVVYLQQADNYQGINQSGSTEKISVDRVKAHYACCVAADRNFPANIVMATIHCGLRKQSVEISNLRLVLLGKVPPSDWPFSQLPYEKTPADQQVLAEASKRIESIRKSNVTVSVIGDDGRAASGAMVSLKQRKHAFAFGSFSEDTPLLETKDAEIFRERLQQLFNRVTLPRYWADWGTDPDEGKRKADAIASWAASNGFELKTHVLLYPTFFPKRVMQLRNEPERFRREVDLAVADALARTAATPMVAWDAINELRDENVLGELFGNQYYSELFIRANQAQPSARWFINEYGILAAEPNQDSNIEQYETRINQILADGGSLEGIGMQCHFQGQLTPMHKAKEILDRFAKFQLPIEVTEFDIDSRDQQTQAQYTRDFMTLLFSHPSVTGITVWGFWEGSMWRPNGAMYRRDWTIKPNGQVWKELTQETWWTNEEASTDALGQATLRAFHGSYDLEVSADGRKATRQIDILPLDQQVSITLAN